jgi:curved DNA-binding protein CbpA
MKNNGPDPYEVLHIAPTATPREVARAYRVLMRSRHPDTRPAHEHPAGPGSTPQELQDIMAAYAVLGNQERRAVYDRDHTHNPAPAPWQRRPGTVARPQGQQLPAASLVIGPVIREPPRRGPRAMPVGPRSDSFSGYTLIWRIRP